MIRKVHRSALIAGLLAFGILAAGPVRADEARDRENAEAAIEYFDKYSKKARDPGKYGDLVMELAQSRHVIVAERIVKELLKTKDEDRQLICAAALLEFKDDAEAKEVAGQGLLKALDSKNFENEAREYLVDKVGKLEYEPGVPKLNEMMLAGGDPWVLLECVRASGRIGSWASLPALLELWERHPVGYSWETGEVSYDSGASGTHDQEMAEKIWNEKYGGAQMKGKGGGFLLKVYIQELAGAVHKITKDKSIKKPDDLRKWMEERSAEFAKLGIKIPEYKGKKKKDKDDD